MMTRGAEENFIAVSVDALNAFNKTKRQTMLDAAIHAPSIVRFSNAIMENVSRFFRFGNPPLRSKEGTQKEGPASMLLFALSVQPIEMRIQRECKLVLHRWHADDGTLCVPIADIKRALDIIAEEGQKSNFILQPTNSVAYWPTINHEKLSHITKIRELKLKAADEAIKILCAPLGSDAFVKFFLLEKLDDFDKAFERIYTLPDRRIAYNVHHVTSSVSQLTHPMRIVPPKSVA